MIYYTLFIKNIIVLEALPQILYYVYKCNLLYYIFGYYILMLQIRIYPLIYKVRKEKKKKSK